MDQDQGPDRGSLPAGDVAAHQLLEAGKASEASTMFDQVVATVPANDVDRSRRASLLVHRAVVAWRLGRVPLALELAAEGWTDIDPEHAEGPRDAQTIGMLGYLLDAIGHRRTALEMMHCSVLVARRAGDHDVLAHCLQRLGGALNFRAVAAPPECAEAMFGEAAELLSEGLRLETDGRVYRALLGAYARSLAGVGQLDRAETTAVEAGRQSDSVRDMWGVAVANWVLAVVHRAKGDRTTARTMASRAVAKAEQVCDNSLLLRFSLDLATICAELGDYVGQSEALHRSVNASRKVTETLQEGLAQALEQRKVAVTAQRVALAARAAASQDPLTGLVNRLGLERSAPHLLERTASLGRVPWLVLVDVDWFKDVNDDAGHAAGDAALREISALLRKECRSEDLVARWAGDEFVVLLVDTNDELPNAGPVVAERIRAAVDAHDWSMVVGHARRPTVSIGVAAGPSNLDQLFAAADIALYRAKRQGRNRVEVHQNETLTSSSDELPSRAVPRKPRQPDRHGARTGHDPFASGNTQPAY